ncbi:hypothetical protein D4R52_03685 [bacterium]|nr:MAG: hypothetical protein D4R52_03685 [bacterium]
MRKNIIRYLKTNSFGKQLGSVFSGAYFALGPGAGTTGVNNDWFNNTIGGFFQASAGSPGAATNVGDLIVSILSILLIVAAAVATVFLILGGYRYVVSAGNEEGQESAKKNITSAIIGLAIIIMAFVIVRLVSGILLKGAGGLGI